MWRYVSNCWPRVPLSSHMDAGLLARPNPGLHTAVSHIYCVAVRSCHSPPAIVDEYQANASGSHRAAFATIVSGYYSSMVMASGRGK